MGQLLLVLVLVFLVVVSFDQPATVGRWMSTPQPPGSLPPNGPSRKRGGSTTRRKPPCQATGSSPNSPRAVDGKNDETDVFCRFLHVIKLHAFL